MIKLLPNLPEHVVGIVASGQVDANDYETVIIPAIESALSSHERIRNALPVGAGIYGIHIRRDVG